ncbi:hypothetical protein BDW66DRAFT_148553 [Aspergillus desertorum]
MTTPEPTVTEETTYDVVIVGGGPVGLLPAYQLKRFGIPVCALEQHKKETQMRMRAIALFPRTLELLDQLGVIEPKLQLGEVHWWTLYTIEQHIAKTFSTLNNCISLRGDAAHTHSGGAAQGLNTETQDAVKLRWELALHIRRLAKKEALETKDIAKLMSYNWPAWYTGDPNADPHLVLGRIFDEAAAFNTGLCISKSNPRYRTEDARYNPEHPTSENHTDRAQYWALVFAGSNNPSIKMMLRALLRYLHDTAPELASHESIGWLTITTAIGSSPYEALGMSTLGDAYVDAAKPLPMTGLE